MSKTTLSNPPPYPSVYGSPIVQTTLGPLNISGSTGSSVWTSNTFSASGHAISGPPAHVLWSTFLFDTKEWQQDTVVRMFTTGRGQAGQGHTCTLSASDTNILTPGRLPIDVAIKSMAWELKRAPSSGPLEELARAAEEGPSRCDESLMGLIAAAAISFESPQTHFCQTLLSHDVPKGQFPWKGIEDWRGGVAYGSKYFNIPAGCSFAVRVDFLDTWRPVYPVSMRVVLEVA